MKILNGCLPTSFVINYSITPQRGTFEIYLTTSGSHGYPNELRVKREG